MKRTEKEAKLEISNLHDLTPLIFRRNKIEVCVVLNEKQIRHNIAVLENLLPDEGVK